jgi:hypothetical protein
MSRMADLYIDISAKLERESTEFADAIECGCMKCDEMTIQAIDTEFQIMSKGWN